MNFKQYIENPLGKKNAVFQQRDMYKAMYTEKFGALNLREAGKIDHTLYYDSGKDVFYAYIKIPSEVVPKFYYDVVIRFHTSDNGLKTSPSLEMYDVQFFSNDPSFVFTYLKVFLDLGMIVEDLKPKSSKLALKHDPVEKNPYKIPGYVKSIYFAYLFMKQRGLFLKLPYKTLPYSKNALLGQVEHSDKKIADRQEKGAAVEKEKRREKAKTANKPARTSASSHTSTSVTKVKNVNRMGPSPSVRKTSSVKRIGKNKK